MVSCENERDGDAHSMNIIDPDSRNASSSSSTLPQNLLLLCPAWQWRRCGARQKCEKPRKGKHHARGKQVEGTCQRSARDPACVARETPRALQCYACRRSDPASRMAF